MTAVIVAGVVLLALLAFTLMLGADAKRADERLAELPDGPKSRVAVQGGWLTGASPEVLREASERYAEAIDEAVERAVGDLDNWKPTGIRAVPDLPEPCCCNLHGGSCCQTHGVAP